jgi:hypothetical protein
VEEKETQQEAEKKTRTRVRPLRVQLQAAFDASDELGLDISSKKLIQTKIESLTRLIEIDQDAELKKLTEEVATLTTQHEADVAELGTLRQRVAALEARQPEVKIVPAPDHAALREANMALMTLLANVASQYGDESERMQAAIRSIQSSTPAAARVFVNALGLDYNQIAQNLLNYKTDAQLYDIVGKGKAGPLLTFARAVIAIRNANTLAKMNYVTLNPAPRDLQAESEAALRKAKTELGVMLRPVRVDEPRTSAENLERQSFSFLGSQEAELSRERVTPAYVQPLQPREITGSAEGADFSPWV